MSRTMRTDGARIQIDQDNLMRSLAKYTAAQALDAVGGVSDETDYTFGFDVVEPGWDPIPLVATLITPIGSSFLVGAVESLLEEDITTGIFFVLTKDDEGAWSVRDRFCRFNDGEITRMDDGMIAQIFLSMC